jgi:uncharacterized membrane protein YfcA
MGIEFLVLGVFAGIAGGFFGIGGGIILIPALIYLFGMNQLQAQGTTLAAMVPPIGLLAAWEYYKHGNVNIPTASFIALGFVVGGLIGAYFALKMPPTVLKKLFALLLLAVSVKMFLEK